jgi:hypothetical protein
LNLTEHITNVLAEQTSARYNYHLPSTPFSLLKQLVMPKWMHEHVYEKVGDESTDGFPLGKEGRRIFLGVKTWSLVSGVVVAGLMAACITGIVWWPALIQAAQLAAYNHSHRLDHSPPVHSHHSEHHGTCNHSPYSKSKVDTVATCGSTIKEAKALNCTWDLLAAAWLPPACIDKELTDDFRAQGPWKFFADRNGTEELLEEELPYRIGEGKEYFTSLKYHRTHCSYQWRKMHRAMQMGTKIENKLADYHHTIHCGYVSMQEGDMEDLLTKITVEFMTC